MKRIVKVAVGLFIVALFAGTAAFAAPSPAGIWKTIDDNDGKPRSLVELTVDEKGELSGVVKKGLRDEPPTNCDLCPGEFKGKPKIGLRFVWGLSQDGEEWNGGKVLDPNNGKIYRCWIRVSPDGKSLELRGYIGISLLGRTQKWYREPVN